VGIFKVSEIKKANICWQNVMLVLKTTLLKSTMAIRIPTITFWVQVLCAFSTGNVVTLTAALIPLQQPLQKMRPKSRFSLTPPRLFSLTHKSLATERDELLHEVLSLSRAIGPVGVLSPEEDRTKLLELARQLPEYSDTEPARYPLRGVFNLVYSANPGPPSGRLVGPFYGKVTQTFWDDNETYINTVQAGPLEISFRAEKKTKDDWTNVVFFRRSTFKLFGQTIVEKDINLKGGQWKYLFSGKVRDSDGLTKIIRVMETPSLFVLEQPVPEEEHK
jgi:hypothetical protein